MAPTIDDFHLLVNSLPNEISERIKPLKWDWFPKDVPFTISSSDKTLNLATDRHSPGRDPRPSVQSNPQEVEEQFPQVIVAEKPVSRVYPIGASHFC
jgi:FAD/FMN-containing dehydrogenase